ncbi:MAG: Sua5/YciO/YrdC/YwlC family protein [Melioribacteraceae bacterium]|nr:Sua5/YciO/YrdC/YwlC family protein [Melioribacteraceae bacterium]
MLSPTTADHVYKQLNDKVDMILDGGAADVGVESTIIEIENDDIYLLRPGGVTKEVLEQILKTKIKNKKSSSDPNSPGQLPFHYSPKTKLKFIDEVNLGSLSDKRVGGIFFEKADARINLNEVIVLSEKGRFSRSRC